MLGGAFLFKFRLGMAVQCINLFFYGAKKLNLPLRITQINVRLSTVSYNYGFTIAYIFYRLFEKSWPSREMMIYLNREDEVVL